MYQYKRDSPLKERLLEIQVSLSLTLDTNEKFKNYIKKKTHKLIVLRFWVKNGINSLCELNSCHIYIIYP